MSESHNYSGRCMGYLHFPCKYAGTPKPHQARCRQCQRDMVDYEHREEYRATARLLELPDRGHGRRIVNDMLRECE